MLSKRKSQNCSTMSTIFVALSAVIVIGIILCSTMMPSAFESGPSSNSLLSNTESSQSLGHNLLRRVEKKLGYNMNNTNLPNWDVPFWTPIDVEVSTDSMITLCRLNFKKYYDAPHSYPMFKDLEGMSSCRGNNRRRERMSVLLKEIADAQAQGLPSGNVIKPTGFVFHESRVGSTLIANFLASDPYSLVFSESTPMANALLHCSGCTKESQLQLFRDVATLMGNSPIHKRLFFKFQSITSTKMEVALEAFPETAWTFVFRSPVQTMMSHLDPRKGSKGAPCLRSKRNPPYQVSDTIRTKTSGGSGAPNEAWCAAHLNYLCSSALNAYSKHSTRVDIVTGETVQRALLVNYDSLPGAIATAILPVFGAPLSDSWLSKMHDESKQYSKSRGTSPRTFSGDSTDKETHATDKIQEFAESILSESYRELNSKAVVAFKAVSPRAEDVKQTMDLITGEVVIDWSKVKELPLTVADIRS